MKRCICGATLVAPGTTTELGGVKHRLNGPCFLCDTHGRRADPLWMRVLSWLAWVFRGKA